MIRIAFIYDEHKLSGKLTKFFTGSYCYHVAFVDVEKGRMYDMHLIRRMRNWPHYPYSTKIVVVDCPVPVSSDYLMDKLLTDESTYGILDYCLFALRPLFHIFGQSTRNSSGIICSEMVADDLQANGWSVDFDEVPSPANLEKALFV